MTRNDTFIEFVDGQLLPDLEKMLALKLQYYAFPIICQAIEVMGGFYDQETMGATNQSEKRFGRALKKLFSDRKYGNQQQIFFSALRSPLIHQLRPGQEFLICSSAHDSMPKEKHLTKHGAATIVIIEEFLSDFKKAFFKLKNDGGKTGSGIIKSKLEDPFLSVFELDGFWGNGGDSSFPCVSGQASEEFR